MRGPRRPEKLPRLMAALGVDSAGVRAVLGPGEPTAREQASLDHWVPTQASLARASRSIEVSGRDRDLTPDTGVTRRSTKGGPATASGDDAVGPSNAAAPATGAGLGLPAGRHRRPRRGPPVAAPPAAFREAHYAVSRRAALAVLLVALLAGALFAARVELARAAGRPSPVTPATSTTGAGGIVARASPTFGPLTPRPPTVAATTGSGTAAAVSGPEGGSVAGIPGPVVVVHVVGQVRKPGVYTLAAGKRVADAVAAAGGATAHADLGALNLARPLVDGEQVRVPRPGEVVASAQGPGGGTGAPPGAGSTGGLVDLNTADLAALDTLPGVGPVLAQRILDWRSAHGSFTSIQELGEVSGIGEKMLAQLTPKVSL